MFIDYENMVIIHRSFAKMRITNNIAKAKAILKPVKDIFSFFNWHWKMGFVSVKYFRYILLYGFLISGQRGLEGGNCFAFLCIALLLYIED